MFPLEIRFYDFFISTRSYLPATNTSRVAIGKDGRTRENKQSRDPRGRVLSPRRFVGRGWVRGAGWVTWAPLLVIHVLLMMCRHDELAMPFSFSRGKRKSRQCVPTPVLRRPSRRRGMDKRAPTPPHGHQASTSSRAVQPCAEPHCPKTRPGPRVLDPHPAYGLRGDVPLSKGRSNEIHVFTPAPRMQSNSERMARSKATLMYTLPRSAQIIQ